MPIFAILIRGPYFTSGRTTSGRTTSGRTAYGRTTSGQFKFKIQNNNFYFKSKFVLGISFAMENARLENEMFWNF